MAANHSSIYKKYLQARHAFEEYTLKFLDRLGSDSKSRKKISLYNTIASWLDFIGEEVPDPIFKDGRSPNRVVMQIIPTLPSEDTEPKAVNIFIEDSLGVREKIGYTGYSTEGTTTAVVSGQINAHPDISSTYNSSDAAITLTFSKGSRYNGGRIIVSNAITYPSAIYISGGADSVTTSLNLTSEELSRIDVLLDKIAIELDLIYSDQKYLELYNIGLEREVTQSLKTANNLSLTAEDGAPLEV